MEPCIWLRQLSLSRIGGCVAPLLEVVEVIGWCDTNLRLWYLSVITTPVLPGRTLLTAILQRSSRTIQKQPVTLELENAGEHAWVSKTGNRSALPYWPPHPYFSPGSGTDHDWSDLRRITLP